MRKVAVLILAGGKGTRMNSDIPKVLHPLKEKTLLEYVIDAVEASSVQEKPLCVVGYQAKQVQDKIGDRATYVTQTEQKGTGHAVAVAASYLEDSHYTLALYGDMPCVRPETIDALVAEHRSHAFPMTMTTTTVDDFEDWREGFYGFGRVVRDENGSIVRLVERKDASEEELEIREVNPAQFIFSTSWLLNNLKTLSADNAQGEYYLTDLVEKAFDEAGGIGSISIDPKEALGVNTEAQLALIESLV